MNTKNSGGASAPPPVPEPLAVPPSRAAPRAATTMVGRVLGLLRGDKYMANAYPPQWRSPTTSPAPAEAVKTPAVQER